MLVICVRTKISSGKGGSESSCVLRDSAEESLFCVLDVFFAFFFFPLSFLSQFIVSIPFLSVLFALI
jgi:hypothetical protein